MYLPARLILLPRGTTMADKWYPLSLDIFTAAVDRDGRARTKKTPSRFLPIKTSRSTYIGGENKAQYKRLYFS